MCVKCVRVFLISTILIICISSFFSLSLSDQLITSHEYAYLHNIICVSSKCGVEDNVYVYVYDFSSTRVRYLKARLPWVTLLFYE